MPRYFLHSCSKIQARREKDLTSEMRLNSAKNVRLKKRDDRVTDSKSYGSLGKKSKNVFRFFEFRLGINFFYFRLGRFGKVESRLGWPRAGVEIGTG